MTYVIGLSGPPGAGKNALADELVGLFERVHGVRPHVTAMAAPLRQIAGQLIGFDMTDDVLYAVAKTTPFQHLNMETGREVMINITEQYLKPRYGPRFWADALIHRVNRLAWRATPENARLVIVTDVGFLHEREALEQAFPHTAFVQLDRAGCSYTGDSRQSIERAEYPDRNRLTLRNPGTNPHQLTALAGRVHDFVLNRLLWDLPAEQIPLPNIVNGD